MPGHRSEVVVVVEQWPAVLDAPGADQEINGLSNRDPLPAKETKIGSRRDRDNLAGHRHNLEPPQQRLDHASVPLTVQTLQYLAKHQITDDELLHAKDSSQAADMRHIAAVEEIDPNTAVDDDHPVPRPLRLRARLPR